MPSREQFNMSVPHKRTGIIFAASAIALIFCSFFFYIRPGPTGLNSMFEGVVGEFSIYFTLFVFAVCISFLSKDLINTNYVVSIGDQGIFDRRITTDWIPWSVIRAVSIVDRSLQKSFLFKISESDAINKDTRRLIIDHSATNKNGSSYEFLVEAGNLKGGFTALHNAVTRFHQISQDGRAH